jgi:hypothetical protein
MTGSVGDAEDIVERLGVEPGGPEMPSSGCDRVVVLDEAAACVHPI